MNRDSGDNAVTQKLVFKVRGPEDDDWLDDSDFTTRIEIVGMNATGVNFEFCADYIDLVEDRQSCQ